MSYTIEFSETAQKVLAKYKKSNPVPFKKIQKFIPELMEQPRTGTGHPEPLVKGNNITYSRRIKGKDRLIYDIDDENKKVNILSVEGHYDDK